MDESYYVNSLQHHRGTAEAWMAAQSDRLGISSEAIETAIKRGWLPDQIAEVSSPMELLVGPPERDVFGLKVVRDG